MLAFRFPSIVADDEENKILPSYSLSSSTYAKAFAIAPTLSTTYAPSHARTHAYIYYLLYDVCTQQWSDFDKLKTFLFFYFDRYIELRDAHIVYE